MKFYKRYPGDYARDTGHLSLMEHGAYTLLLDLFYGTGEPLSTDEVRLFKVLRAKSRHERDAVRAVLAEFWEQTPDGWINRRGTEELETYEERRVTNRENARSGWEKRRHDRSGKRPPPAREPHASRMQSASRSQCNPEPEPEPESINNLNGNPFPPNPHARPEPPPSPEQLEFIRDLAKKAGKDTPTVRTKREASLVIDSLRDAPPAKEPDFFSPEARAEREAEREARRKHFA